ncbi:MAG: CotH kinase family protein [Bacteroidaceae bacterium]|nr:CotH kinase family protein [Bacteroidaceae bacterium]
MTFPLRLLLAAMMCLLSATYADAQIKSLSELKSNKKYLIKNANGYGYCIYRDNPNAGYYYYDYVTLGGATAEHPSGCIDPTYKNSIDPKDNNCLWYIRPDGKGAYNVINVGQRKYLTNQYVTYYEGWNEYRFEEEAFFIDSEVSALEITEIRAGVFAFRAKGVTRADMYMCAASQLTEPIATWTIDDLGSEWMIVDPDNPDTPDIPDEPDIPDTPDEPDEPDEDLGPLTFFYLSDTTMMAFPDSLIISREEDEDFIYLNMEGDTTYTIAKSHIVKETAEYEGELPVFESFKFNDKFNDQLLEDAEGVIDNDSNIIRVAATVIGKRLIPSFKKPDNTIVYSDGEIQTSKHSSMRFDKVKRYTLANRGEFVYKVVKTRDEEWYVPEQGDTSRWINEKIELQSDWLSTNADTNRPGEEGLENLLDEDTNTIFHSTWGTDEPHKRLTWYSGAYYGDGISEWPYIQVYLPEAEHKLSFSYTNRNSDNRYPKGILVQVSKDGKTWTDIRKFTYEEDGMTSEPLGTWTSPVMSIKQNYSYVRLQLTDTFYKNYFVLSELSLLRQVENPDRDTTEHDSILIHPAEYEGSMQPYGRKYKVYVDFATDHSTAAYQVPTIRINTFDGTMISSKSRYWDASFELDGAGIWEDIRIDSMQIKGRGNSSWSSSPYAKNPYRMKFPEKIKPFGLTKGKNWVLLANKQSESMTSNAIAMKIAGMVQTAGCNHMIPVELYINGSYRGSYNFTEKVGFANNSIDLDDESHAVMLELDTYYDEAYKFTDTSMGLKVNVKEPEWDDTECTSQITFEDVQKQFQKFVTAVSERDLYYVKHLDIDKFCRAMLVTDLTRNCEYKHPKSWFLYNTDITADSLWVFGPVWDFDWAFGYDGTSQYYRYSATSDLFNSISTENKGAPFFQILLRSSKSIKKAYYKLWTNFINDGRMEQLLEYIDDYYEFANPSFQHNASSWGDGYNYEAVSKRSKDWLAQRAEYIYSNLEEYPLEEGDIFVPEEDQDAPNSIDLVKELTRPVNVYNMSGIIVRQGVPVATAFEGLPSGIYIMEGRKFYVR